jgi:hypothetical protein
VGRWQRELNRTQQDLADQALSETLKQFGYS